MYKSPPKTADEKPTRAGRIKWGDTVRILDTFTHSDHAGCFNFFSKNILDLSYKSTKKSSSLV